MAEFLNSVSAVFVIFLIMAVGYVLGMLGWLTASEKSFLSKYVVNVAVPVNCIVGLLNQFTREDLVDAGVMLATGIAVVALSLLLSAAAATLLRLPRNRWGVFVAMGGLSNTMFIGQPMTMQLFGEASLPYMMTYYLSTTIFTQSVGVALVEQAGRGTASKLRWDKIILDLLKKPPIIGVIVAAVMLILDVRPPALLMKAGGYISNTVTPLALIYCGFILYEVGLKNLKLLPGLPAMLLIRLVIAPMICVGMCALTEVSGLARSVFIVMAALPVVTQVTVMAGAYGADEEYAATGACLSMLGIFITIPVLMLFL